VALPLKTAGLAELTAFRKRLNRQLAMERIHKEDYNYIIGRLGEIEARVISMIEEGGDGNGD
jgi:hypothetical protein